MITMKRRKNLVQVFASVVLLSFIMLPMQANALEVPVSQTEQMIDGTQTLVKVFEVPASRDPEDLVEPNLQQNGYKYYMTSIVKDSIMTKDEMEVTQEHTVTIPVSNEDNARLEALKSFPTYLEYEEDGYEGKLYPVITTLEGKETGRTNHAGKKTITRTTQHDYNDDSLIPTTDSGYTLSNINWSEGAYVNDSSIPETYVATATYTKRYSYSTVDGWEFKMLYSGDVEYEEEDTVRYTVTYVGEKIGFFSRLFNLHNEGATVGEQKSGGLFSTLAGVLALLVGCAAAGFGIFAGGKYFSNHRISVYGRNEESGEFEELYKIWFKEKEGTIEIDTLSKPEIQFYKLTLKPELAEELKGKVITIIADQHVEKHCVGDAGGADYIIDVNLTEKQ